jgi:lipooligosaccharide transport system ATP-binding protein
MKMMYGFNTVSSGSLQVLWWDVSTCLRKVKERLGIIPQEDNLDPDLKVFQNLCVYASYFGISVPVALERAEQALQRFQLIDKRAGYI